MNFSPLALVRRGAGGVVLLVPRKKIVKKILARTGGETLANGLPRGMYHGEHRLF